MVSNILIGEYQAQFDTISIDDSDKSFTCDDKGEQIETHTTASRQFINRYKGNKQEYKGKVYYNKNGEITETKPKFESTKAVKSSEIDELEIDFPSKLLTEKYLLIYSDDLKETLKRFKICFGFPFVLKESEKSYYLVIRLEQDNLIGYLARDFKDNAIERVMSKKPLTTETSKLKHYIQPKNLLKDKFKVVIESEKGGNSKAHKEKEIAQEVKEK